MKSKVLLIPLLLILSLAFVQCANRGRPTGGALDSIPPVPLRILPKNYSTNFSDKEIIIQFDEYIKLDKLQENLVISPPLDKSPIITPTNVGKTLKIVLQEDLKENTTYTFNFGNSIIDNNEGNALEQFTYVLSTGNSIDSLELYGSVKDARLLKLNRKAGVNLYRIDENWNDSIIYSGKPDYMSMTNEEGDFKFSNLKAGKYFLVGIQKETDGASLNYNPNTDKLGFYSSYIELPSDSLYIMDLYKAKPEYKMERPKQKSNQSFEFAYQGASETPKISLKDKAISTKEYQFKDVASDSIYYWYKPISQKDSLAFSVSHLGESEDFHLRLREVDTLAFKINSEVMRSPSDSLIINSSTPIVAVDKTKFQLIDKDSTALDFNLIHKKEYNYIALEFEKDYEQKYSLSILPGAIVDWYEKENDTLKFTSTIKSESSFGSLQLQISGIETYPVIVDLINDRSKVIRSFYMTQNQPVYFPDLNSGKYYVRLSFDINKNGKWDIGDIEKRILPEPVYFFSNPIEVHENWSINETLQVRY